MAMLNIYIVVIFVISFSRNRLTRILYIMHLGSLYVGRRNFGTKLNKCTRTLQTYTQVPFKYHCMLRCAVGFTSIVMFLFVCTRSVVE